MRPAPSVSCATAAPVNVTPPADSSSRSTIEAQLSARDQSASQPTCRSSPSNGGASTTRRYNGAARISDASAACAVYPSRGSTSAVGSSASRPPPTCTEAIQRAGCAAASIEVGDNERNDEATSDA